MCAADPHFFVSRYAAVAAHDRFIYRAVESIRRLYPLARVTVVDDNSSPEFTYSPDCALTDVVANPYPRSGEVGTLRVAWATLLAPDDVAVTMHDGMVLTARLPPGGLPPGSDMCFLWHFDRYGAMHLPQTLRLLSALTLPDADMLLLLRGFMQGFNSTWRGCFGAALASRKRALDAVHRACGLFGAEFMGAVSTRESRQAAERVVGLVAHAYGRAPNSKGLIPSVCGSIFDHPSPWSTDMAGEPLESILARRYPAPFFKTWSGR